MTWAEYNERFTKKRIVRYAFCVFTHLRRRSVVAHSYSRGSLRDYDAFAM